MTADQGVVFLEGKKVVLRPPSKSDLPLLLRWVNDPEIRGFVNQDFPTTESDEEAWLSSNSKKNQSNIVFVIVAEGKPIGVMGLHRINWRDGTATSGAMIGDKDCQNKGYGKEAKLLLLNYAFNTLNLRKICSQVLATNHRSIAYNRACGYKVEGVLKKHVFRHGWHQDLVELAVFRKDFFPIWRRYRKSL